MLVPKDLPWNPEFNSNSAIFSPLANLAVLFSHFGQWPALNDYQKILDGLTQPILTHHGKALKIAEQGPKTTEFEQCYAPRIYLTGEIQTRLNNWHDFFQFLTWLIFPVTKAAINAIHYRVAGQRFAKATDLGRRDPVENMLSLFDEGGAVVVSSDPELLQLIRDFRWKELFWQRREELENKLDCVVFGHALYEKSLLPYIGMTANCILLLADEAYFTRPMPERLQWIDGQLRDQIENNPALCSPKALAPLPILGMPGWDPANGAETYYDNVRYFRPGRSQ